MKTTPDAAGPLEATVGRQRAYIEAIKPYMDMRYRVYCETAPKLTIYPDGRIEHEYNFTPEQKEVLRLAEEGVQAVKRAMQLATPLTSCACDNDGECSHAQCPQLRDDEPARSGRSCPLYVPPEEY